MLTSATLPGALCAALALSAELVGAVPALSTPAGPAKGQSIPLRRRLQPRSTAELQAQAAREAAHLKWKYGARSKNGKRASTASEPLVDHNSDLQYFGVIQVVCSFPLLTAQRHGSVNTWSLFP